MKRRSWTVVAALTLAPFAGAQEPAPGPSSTAPPRSVEARAEQELKKMGEFLAKLPHFALEAEETFDELPDGELRRQLTNVRRVAVERPNHVAADATGDTLNRASWYDGRTVTVLDKEHNVYATIEAQGRSTRPSTSSRTSTGLCCRWPTSSTPIPTPCSWRA
jgi:hypothetical protein